MVTSPQATREGEEPGTIAQFGIAVHKSDFRKISDIVVLAMRTTGIIDNLGMKYARTRHQEFTQLFITAQFVPSTSFLSLAWTVVRG